MPGSGDQGRELMSGQLGIWYAQLLSADSAAYNVGEYLEIVGDLDVGLFEMALRRTVSETGALQFCFREEGGVPRQYPSDLDGWPLHVLDVSAAADPRAAAEDWMRADMRCPVDLSVGPLFTQAMFTVAPGRFFWYNRVHHIAVDGLSAPAGAARLAQVYESLLAGDPACGGGPGAGVGADGR
jgi:nonribosomal peptide synthetase DhbF